MVGNLLLMANPKRENPAVTNQSCTIVLLRHAHSTANQKGILAGRDNAVGLSPRGEREAQALVSVLKSYSFDAIYTSPLKRCIDTITPFLKSSQQKAVRDPGLLEMEYGSWSGKKLNALSKQKMWEMIQQRPSLVRFPEGESFTEMSSRANQTVIDRAKGLSNILIVSHGDVIKSIVAFHLGLPLDSFQRIAIDPASLTMIRFPQSHVISVNVTTHLQDSTNSHSTNSQSTNRHSINRHSINRHGARDRFSLGGGAGQK
jgi:probable phosphomutase (TIGR03848 family)